MDKEDIDRLQRERNYIAQQVASSGKFADVVYELKQRDVLQPEKTIELLNSGLTKTDRMRNLLCQLETCRPETFDIFLEVLIQFGLSHIALKIDPRAYERHGRIVSGGRDRLDAEMLPDFIGVGEPTPNVFPNLPSLPPRDSARRSFDSDRNGNDSLNVDKVLTVNVIPAAAYGGAHMEQSALYPNQSMPRGLVFLANYKNFVNDDHPVREGSEIDVRNLCILFHQMGYKVPQVHVNLTKYDTIKALREFKNLEEQKSVDSCIVIIMSHGRDGKSFYTSDNHFLSVNDVVERFNNRECEALKGKPKIFIFQYCRGSSPDVGVSPTPRLVKGDGGMLVETDSSYTSIVDRDPTFTDMYIVYSTVEGFVSFRHPERGSWLMEAICNVFMKNAHKEELETLMKMVSRQVRQNLTDEGNKQVCEFVQRAFDLHFFFNPQQLNSTERLSMQSLSHALDYREGAASPIHHMSHRHLRPESWARASTPELLMSPVNVRHRNLSGASNSSDYTPDELDPSFLNSGSVIIHPRARRRSGNQRHASEAIHFLQPSHIPDHLESYNRSFSETVLASSILTPDPMHSSRNEVFAEVNLSSPGPLSYDMVDHTRESFPVHITEKVKLEKSDVNMNQAVSCEEQGVPRHSIKRQLSIPSTMETLTKINDVKKYLQVHDSDPQLIERLQRVESFVNKKKYEGKRRKKETEASSLDF